MDYIRIAPHGNEKATPEQPHFLIEPDSDLARALVRSITTGEPTGLHGLTGEALRVMKGD